MTRWININDHPNYEVSNDGQVRNKRTGHILKPLLNRENGYARVSLNGQRCYIHRLVAQAFYDNSRTDMDVNHIDGNKLNNNIANLEWSTRKENVKHAYINGLKYSSFTNVVRCKFCKQRNETDFCSSQPDYFYCYDGER